MGLMLIGLGCILCFKTGECADESHTINEAYHLMASQPTLWLTDKAFAKCHGREQCACEIRARENKWPTIALVSYYHWWQQIWEPIKNTATNLKRHPNYERQIIFKCDNYNNIISISKLIVTISQTKVVLKKAFLCLKMCWSIYLNLI